MKRIWILILILFSFVGLEADDLIYSDIVNDATIIPGFWTRLYGALIGDSTYTNLEPTFKSITMTGLIESENINADGSIVASGLISTAGDLSVADSLYVGDDIVVNDDVTVGGNLTASGDLEGNNLQVNTDLSIDVDCSVGDSLYVDDDLVVRNDVTVGGNLAVKDMVILTNQTNNFGNTTIYTERIYMVDDSVYTIGRIDNGFGQIQDNDGDYLQFAIINNVVTQIDSIGDTAVTDIDGKLCVYFSSLSIVIKNRTDGTRTVFYTITTGL